MLVTKIWVCEQVERNAVVVQVTEEIWVCEKNTITNWEGDIYSYKTQLARETKKERAKSIKP